MPNFSLFVSRWRAGGARGRRLPRIREQLGSPEPRRALVNRVILVLGALLSSAGCESSIMLLGRVEVAAELTSGLTQGRRGVVVVRADVPKTGPISYRLAVLCEPSPNDLVLDWVHDGHGCAKRGTVTARLYQVGESDSCGIETVSFTGWFSEPPTVLAEARALVFAGKGIGFGCSSGQDSVALRLAR